ncbi:MAG: CotH kinase family protein [Bacteroidetes bacterium]|nr:CotH kinase family protein [Bacteroidota bacterium]
MKKLLFILLSLSLTAVAQQPEEVVSATNLVFEPAGGIYDKGVTVTLKSDLPNARIFYTLDGSEPGSGSMRYTQPIRVTSVSVIRAIAYGDGKQSIIVTNSYFCDRKYTLPIVSITTNPANLWDFASGIYVKGCCADTLPPYLGANFWYDWERRANVEMYEPTGECAFNQQAGIGIFGGFSKGLPQKSLYVTARDKYGKNKFDYPIFPERENIDSYKSFILRNAGGDFGKTHFRDAFMTQLAKPTGIAIQAYRPAIVFLNGQYWGIQNLREKINEHYLEDNFGVDKDNVDLMEHRDGAKHGNSKAYRQLLNFLATKDMTSDAVIAELRKQMDIENYMTYNIAEVYSDNRDAGGNIRYFKERNDSSQWRWIFYDTEMGLGNNNPLGYKNNTLKKFTSVNNEIWPDPPWSTFIIRSLLANKKLEIEYINMFADQLNTIYHADTAVRLMNKIADGIRTEIPYHQKRWGSTVKSWEENVAVLKTFVTQRPFYLRQFIMEKFGLTDTAYVHVYSPGEEQGDITLNSLKIKRDFKGVYFKNVPVTIKAEPKHDYEFVGWKGRNERSSELTIMLTEDLELIPVFQPKRRSIFADSVIINEICFFQHESDTSGDWAELYNHSGKDIDLSGWVFTESSYKKGFVVPNGTLLQKNGFIILAENRDLVSNSKCPVVGNFDFGLSKKGEKITLYDQEGFVVDSLTYGAYNKDVQGENTFSVNLIHPDSVRCSSTAWANEVPNPGEASLSYRNFLQSELDKAYWTKVLFMGGGGFFFILAVGLWFFRSFKKRHNLTP